MFDFQEIDVPTTQDASEKPSRMKFSRDEDQRLRSLVGFNPDPDWKTIAEMMGNGRTTRQCRERFNNYLSPRLKNGPWAKDEEELLELKFNELGPRWAKMVVYFPGRSDVNLKNHWTSMVNRKKKALRLQKQSEENKLKAKKVKKPRKTVPKHPRQPQNIVKPEYLNPNLIDEIFGAAEWPDSLFQEDTGFDFIF